MRRAVISTPFPRGNGRFQAGRNCAFFVFSAKASRTTLGGNRKKGCPMIRVMFAVLMLAVVLMLSLVLVLTAGSVVYAGALQPPEGRKIRVAVVMTEGAVVIDYAGPWEVFANVHTGKGDMGQQMPFELYTVGRDRQPIHTSGGDRKSTRLNSSHLVISYAVFCLKKKNLRTLRPEFVREEFPKYQITYVSLLPLV